MSLSFFYLLYGCGCFLLPSLFSLHQSFQTLVWISVSFLDLSFCTHLVLFWIIFKLFSHTDPFKQTRLSPLWTVKRLLEFFLCLHCQFTFWFHFGSDWALSPLSFHTVLIFMDLKPLLLWIMGNFHMEQVGGWCRTCLHIVVVFGWGKK